MEQQDNEVEGQDVAAAIEMSNSLPTPTDGETKTVEEDKDSCRICRGDASPEQPLFYPCKCSGSIKYVHQDCLMEWLSHSQKKYCELCKTPFRFTKLYDQSMPQTLPLPLFLRQVVIHTSRASFRWIRYVLVAFVWACWLPWFIRLLWRALFWLADGSWASPKIYHDAILDGQVPLPEAGNATALQVSTVLPYINSTVRVSVKFDIRQSLPFKIAQSLYPNAVSWAFGIVSMNAGDKPLVHLTSERQPSLLSEVDFIRNLTNYSVLNNTIIDVLEGQLICLSIITAFILVFLIREWVINQQPIANMPDPDRLDEAAPAAEPRNAAQRRRRRHAIHGNAADVANVQQANGQRLIAVPRRQRRIANAENVGPPVVVQIDQAVGEGADRTSVSDPDPDQLENGYEGEDTDEAGPPVLVRGALDTAASIQRDMEERATNAAPFEPPSPILNPEPGAESRAWSLEYLSQFPVADQKRLLQEAVYPRVLLQRPELAEKITDMMLDFDTPFLIGLLQDDAALREQIEHAHRVYDEAHRIANGYYKNQGQSSNPASSADQATKVLAEHRAGQTDAEDDSREDQPQIIAESEHAIHSADLQADAESSTAHLLSSTSIDESTDHPIQEIETSTSANDGDAFFDDEWSHSSTEDIVPTPSTTSNQVTEASVDATTPENLPTESANGTSDSRDVPDEGVLEKIFAWMWHIDDSTPSPAEAVDEDAEHIVQDPAAEAPFVPVRPRVAHAHADNQNDGPEAPGQQAQPNVFLGVDLNDPDAIDDAEDIEGILDLVGMQGPIGNMVLNVMFSVFLITLTIAASIWLPYIWGKIALLILANPFDFFVKAPLHLASKASDIAIDLVCFTFALLAILGTNLLKAVQIPLSEVSPKYASWLDLSRYHDFVNRFAQTHGRQLEHSLADTVVSMKPDLSTFSTQSHYALRLFEKQISTAASMASLYARKILLDLPSNMQRAPWRAVLSVTKADVYITVLQTCHMVQSVAINAAKMLSEVGVASVKAHRDGHASLDATDGDVVRWTSRDRILAIVLGYLLFACVGFLYLKIERLVLGDKADERANGIIGDGVRQAGGVLKVVVIIGIEMIVFPLYCGFLLDIALLPLFQGATIQSRVAFMMRAPITGLFVHWFIGTCYMFHFALFVSMCRKILRKGVLYFIRDPDDPTFHPVRDVLERPVATQLGKIAFSAVIYGGLVILCLGGVIYTLSGLDSVLPIHWATNEPRLAFPVDVVFYNFMLPFIIRKAEPSNKISAMYAWWFRGCAHGLRLTNFLFGEDREEEKVTHVRQSWMAKIQLKHGDVQQPVIGEDRRLLVADRQVDAYFFRDGTYVRAPASDSVRIPKGDRVFLEVNENNERVDRLPDHDKGVHGKRDERFTKVYIPPHFRTRIATFIFLIWIFAAITGVAFTIGPLILGRQILKYLAQSSLPPNDLYSFTIGIHITAGITYAASKWHNLQRFFAQNAGEYLATTRRVIPQALSTAKYAAGMIYMALFFGLILPFLLSMLAELYLHVPLYTYLVSNTDSTPDGLSDPQPLLLGTTPFPATIFLLQTWTLGLLYTRIVLRAFIPPTATDHHHHHHPNPSRASLAIRAITRHGSLNPDIPLATRSFVIPALIICGILFLTPLLLGYLLTFNITDLDIAAKVYRYAYPGLLAASLAVYCAVLLKRQVGLWRMRIRDEVYLIGERLHNYKEGKRSTDGALAKSTRRAERVEIMG